MPDFIVIGAAKAGTTALYHYLRQDPQICMTSQKEPHFFTFEGQSPTFHGPYDREVWQSMVVTELEAYQALFKHQPDALVRGEISTNYLYYHEMTAHRILSYVPDVKLIVILRNPVNRAYSAYLHRRRDGREPATTFLQALELETERIRQKWGPGAHYIQGGFYAEALKTYLSTFTPQQIRIYLYEKDIQLHLTDTLDDIADFLGLDATMTWNTHQRYNEGYTFQNPIIARLHRLFVHNPSLQQSLHYLLPDPFFNRLQTRYRRIKESYQVKTQVDPALYKQLIALYRDDILESQKLIRRDLSFWLDQEIALM